MTRPPATRLPIPIAPASSTKSRPGAAFAAAPGAPVQEEDRPLVVGNPAAGQSRDRFGNIVRAIDVAPPGQQEQAE